MKHIIYSNEFRKSVQTHCSDNPVVLEQLESNSEELYHSLLRHHNNLFTLANGIISSKEITKDTLQSIQRSFSFLKTIKNLADKCKQELEQSRLKKYIFRIDGEEADVTVFHTNVSDAADNAIKATQTKHSPILLHSSIALPVSTRKYRGMFINQMSESSTGNNGCYVVSSTEDEIPSYPIFNSSWGCVCYIDELMSK
jgi:hypothetical protein